MSFNTVLLVRVFLLAVALVLASLASVVWRRRELAPEAPAFAALLVAVSLYAFGYSGEVAQRSLAAANFWLKVEYLGIPWIPGLWLLAMRKRAGLQPHAPLLFVIPAVVFAGHVTDPWLHLFNRSIGFSQHAPFWVVETNRGAIAWLNIGYLSLALLWGAWTSLLKLRSAHSLFRKQGWLIVGSSMAPFAVYLIYLAGWSPYGLDLGSLGLSISAALGSFNIFGLRCFDLTPLAREHVFSCMRDAVLVLDMQNRLIDFNPAARELLRSVSEHRLGEDVSCLLPDLPALEYVLQQAGSPVTFALEKDGRTEHFEIRAFAIRARTRQIGWAAILADVTARVELVRSLRHYAETDPLTGIGNRRRFFSALEKEFHRCERYGSTFSVLILDLDHFKAINDQYGHPAGDKVLCFVCEQMAHCLRSPDLLTRYGGEEFAVLLPLTSLEGAFAVADRIRAAIADAPVEYEEETIPVSASIGVACYDKEANPDLLLRKADRALYRAKEAGRNRVEAWLPEINRPQPAHTS